MISQEFHKIARMYHKMNFLSMKLQMVEQEESQRNIQILQAQPEQFPGQRSSPASQLPISDSKQLSLRQWNEI